MNRLQKLILPIALVSGLSLPCGAPCQPLRAMNEIAPAHFMVSRQDLEHGERQVKNLIHDRPRMAKYVVPGNPVWKWLVEQFAGEGIGCRIYWQSGIPISGATAENHPREYGGRAAIRVRNSDATGPLDGELQCAAAVFELLNIRNGAEFNRACRKYLDTKPSNKKLTAKPRKEFVEKTTMLEYNALVSHRSFYYLIWRPSMQARKIKSDQWLWRTHIAYPYPAWIKTNDASSYVKYWSKAYDNWKN